MNRAESHLNQPAAEGRLVPAGRRLEIVLVVAASENNVIGRDGGLPWRLPDDLRHFKRVTLGRPVIMGRKTFDELFRKPLPGRANVIVSRTMKDAPGAVVRPSLHDAVEYAGSLAAETSVADPGVPPELCIIGGGEIFRQSMDLATRVILTRVHAVVEGDATFPDLPPDRWRLDRREHHTADDRHAHAFTFEWWSRA